MRQSVKDDPGSVDASGMMLIKGGAKRKHDDADLYEEDEKIKLLNSVEDGEGGRSPSLWNSQALCSKNQCRTWRRPTAKAFTVLALLRNHPDKCAEPQFTCDQILHGK